MILCSVWLKIYKFKTKTLKLGRQNFIVVCLSIQIILNMHCFEMSESPVIFCFLFFRKFLESANSSMDREEEYIPNPNDGSTECDSRLELSLEDGKGKKVH